MSGGSQDLHYIITHICVSVYGIYVVNRPPLTVSCYEKFHGTFLDCPIKPFIYYCIGRFHLICKLFFPDCLSPITISCCGRFPGSMQSSPPPCRLQLELGTGPGCTWDSGAPSCSVGGGGGWNSLEHHACAVSVHQRSCCAHSLSLPSRSLSKLECFCQCVISPLQVPACLGFANSVYN